MISQLALVSNVAQVGMSDLSKVSAALQKQIARDFGPIWGIQATIDPFASLDDVPVGYWPVIVIEDIPGPSTGTHPTRNGQPYALVEFGPTWSLAASHEVLEMLADPLGGRLVAGDSPRPGQGRVEFLMEVCDPCQDARFAYLCNGFLVSDFITPSYFDPVRAANVRYSFGPSIGGPREVLPGGCLSWRDPTSDVWHQLNRFHDQPEFKDLGEIPVGATLRPAIYARMPRVQKLSRLDEGHPQVATALAKQEANAKAARSNATSLRKLIKSRKDSRYLPT